MAKEEGPVSPTRVAQGVHTGPTLSAANEIAELRAEVDRLRKIIGDQKSGDLGSGPWGGQVPSKIPYHKVPHGGARLGGITKAMFKAGKIRPTSDFDYLPKPCADMDQLEADFMRWGYCIVKDALSPEQVKAQVDRMVDQAEAEKAAKVAMVSHGGAGQTIGNVVAKGQVFRDIVAFEESACQKGPLVEALLHKMLGAGFYCGTAHGSIVHQGGGLQDLHQDQGYVPLPHPPYPMAILIIWTFSEFSLENGGTYLLPGSHIDEHGHNRVRPDNDFEKIHLREPGLLALTCPPGQCYIMDARVLHSGATRTAPGTRYAMRNLYIRGFLRHQENMFLGVPDDVLLKSSPKLRKLMGFQPHMGMGMVNLDSMDPQVKKVPIPELSMSRPEEFDQDFDIKHSNLSKAAAESGSPYNEYLGPRWEQMKKPKAKL